MSPIDPGAISGVISAPVIMIVQGDGENVISWPNVTDAEGYDLYRDTVTRKGKLSANVFTGVTSPHTDPSLVNNTEYFYVAVAWNDTLLEESNASVEQSGIPQSTLQDIDAWVEMG